MFILIAYPNSNTELKALGTKKIELLSTLSPCKLKTLSIGGNTITLAFLPDSCNEVDSLTSDLVSDAFTSTGKVGYNFTIDRDSLVLVKSAFWTAKRLDSCIISILNVSLINLMPVQDRLDLKDWIRLNSKKLLASNSNKNWRERKKLAQA